MQVKHQFAVYLWSDPQITQISALILPQNHREEHRRARQQDMQAPRDRLNAARSDPSTARASLLLLCRKTPLPLLSRQLWEYISFLIRLLTSTLKQYQVGQEHR